MIEIALIVILVAAIFTIGYEVGWQHCEEMNIDSLTTRETKHGQNS